MSEGDWKICKIKLVFSGLIIGIVNGFFGAGGGILVIPIIKNLFGISEKKAHATATAIILPLCIISSIIMVRNYKLNLWQIFIISTGGVIGGMIGAKFLNKISSDNLKKIFGIFILIAAIKMII